MHVRSPSRFSFRTARTALIAGIFATAAMAGCAKDSEAAAPRSAEAQIGGANFKAGAAPATCAPNAECKATITVEALGEYHINEEYPYKFTANDSDGIEFLGKEKKNVFSKAAGDFKLIDKNHATLTISFKAAKNATISGKLKLSVCSAANCAFETPDISIAVTAK